MKIVKCPNTMFMQIDEDMLNSLGDKYDKCISEVFDTIPDEAMPTEEEIALIKKMDAVLCHLDSKLRRWSEKLRPAFCYKQWWCIAEQYSWTDDPQEFRNTSIVYDVDIEKCLTAALVVDFTNKKFLVELREIDIPLPTASEETDDMEYALDLLQDYIENPGDYLYY